MSQHYNPNCTLCSIQKRREEEAQQVDIKFVHDGQIMSVKAKRFSDAFYEIKVGKYSGNLVHIFDVVK